MPQQNRQLAAILFTDIVGYTAMMQQDEKLAVALVKHYIAVLKKTITDHGGQVLNDYGDGSLCIFPSSTEALKAAVEIQQQLQSEPAVPLRIGLHLGEIFFEDEKVMGDSINVASRIQSMGQANTILFSKEIADKIKNQPEFKPVSLGKFEFKNVDEPMEVFALANEGLIVPKREEMSGKLKEIQKKYALRKWLAFVTLIVLLVAGFFIYKYFTAATDFKGEKSIAVLPFENSTKDASQEYISDGITEAIINKLGKVSSLKKVIGWFSVKSFKKTTKTLLEISNELGGVAAILTGSIQTEANKIRVTWELNEISTNKRLSGDDFKYEDKNIISIQSIVAGEIVTALKAEITPEEKINLSKHYTENIDAYKFYLRGRNFWYAQSPENFDSAENNYKKAIQLEPNYALAYAGLADCYAISYRGMPQRERVPIAKIYVEKALSLDSTLSEAYTTMGFIQQNFDYNWSEARKNLEKAIDLNPNNSAAHLYYGLVLMHSTPDKETALREMKKAVELEPLSYITNWILSRNYYFAGKYDLAIDQFKKMSSFIPKSNQYVSIFSLGLIYLKKHLYSQAKEAFDQLPEGNGAQIDNSQIMQSYGYAVLGDKIKAKTLLEKTLKKYPNLSHYRNSQVYVALGNFDEAMNQLELGYAIHDVHMFWIKVDPEFGPIRNEPRFKELLKKMGLE